MFGLRIFENEIKSYQFWRVATWTSWREVKFLFYVLQTYAKSLAKILEDFLKISEVINRDILSGTGHDALSWWMDSLECDLAKFWTRV